MWKILSGIRPSDRGALVTPQSTTVGSPVNSPDTVPTDDQRARSLRGTEEPEIASLDDLAAGDIVIAVMGPTGSGKSTFICAASGCNTEAVGHGLKSNTCQVRPVRFWDQETSQHIVLVDTPGFDDTFRSDLDTLRLISEWLVSSYKKQNLLCGILYLHRIADNRVTGSSLKNLQVFRKLCGRDALGRVYLTTTMWDEVESGVGESRLKELKRKYWKTMVAQGAQVACCRSDDDSPKRLVRQIVLSDVGHKETLITKQEKYQVSSSHSREEPRRYDVASGDRKVLLIQKEMVQLNKELKETSAGRQLYSELEPWIKKQLDLLRRIEKERTATSNPETLRELQREYNDLRPQIDNGLNQMQQLKLPWLKRLFSCS